MDTQDTPHTKGIIAAIVFAALIISGSLVFLGLQLSQSGEASIADDSDVDIEKLLAQLEAGEDPFGDSAPPSAPTVTADIATLVDDDASMGDEDAPVVLVEFSDYQCPFCGRHFSQTYPSLKADYIDTGKLRFVFRDFPLSFHYDATPAAIAAECVRDQGGDDMYFDMHEKIFAGVANTGSIPVATLEGYATDLGVNMSTFKECMDSPEKAQEVESDLAAGSQLGVSGTPGFIVSNGTEAQLISGAQPYAAFKQAIDRLLNE